MTDKLSNARDTYQAYLRGDITAEQAQKRAEAWYEARFPNAVHEPFTGDADRHSTRGR